MYCMVTAVGLVEAPWLSKDVIFVFTDGRFGDIALREWLKEYHSPSIDRSSSLSMSTRQRNGFSCDIDENHPYSPQRDLCLCVDGTSDNFLRGGIVRAALNLDFTARNADYLVVSVGTSRPHQLQASACKHATLTHATIHAPVLTRVQCTEGENGSLPNLDLVNVVDRLSRFVARIPVSLFDSSELVTWLRVDSPLAALPTAMNAVLCFMIKLAIGQPSGDHGVYHRYNIEAVTLKVMTFYDKDDGSMGEVGKYVANNKIATHASTLQHLV
jgi:hypothetical protein